MAILMLRIQINRCYVWNGIVSALLNAYVYWNVSDTRFNNLHISTKMFLYVNFWVYICNETHGNTPLSHVSKVIVRSV